MNNTRFKLLAISLLIAASMTALHAQTSLGNIELHSIGLRTNLIPLAFGSPGVGVDVAFNGRWQVGVDGSYGCWDINHTSNHALRLSSVGGEVRRYFRDDALSGNHQRTSGGFFQGPGLYAGADVRYGHFNKLSDGAGKHGERITIGLLVGYSIQLPAGWGIDASLGCGYVHKNYDCYRWYSPAEQNAYRGTSTSNGFGLTNAALNITYHFNL